MDDHIQDKISQLYGEIGEWIEECDRLKARLYDANEEIVRLKDMEVRLRLLAEEWCATPQDDCQFFGKALSAALDEGADDE